MADDIVNRLRELMADLLYNPDCDDEGCGDCAWHRIGADAIAEIKRLRAVNRNLHAECARMQAERDHLRVALAIAVGELSTHGEYTARTPEMLMNQLLEEATKTDGRQR